MSRLIPRVALVCVALVSTLSPASAQTVDEIIAKNLEAKGGAQRLRETTTVRLSGTLTMQGVRGTTLSLAKRPNAFRREMDMSGQKMIQGYDGTTLWIQRTGMAAQEMPPGPQADAMKQNATDFDSAFLDWQQKGHKIEYKGKVTEGGKEFYHLLFTPKAAPAMEYFIDPSTGLEVKVVMTGADPSGKDKAEVRFSDYRNVDGRMIPFVTTNLVNGTQVMQVRLDRVEFNVPIDDALFKMPK